MNQLYELKKKFLEERTEESLQEVLDCMHDAVVIVPEVKSPVKGKKLRPDLFKNQQDDVFFPIFSSVDELPENYKELVETVEYPAVKCIEMAKATEGVKCLVLDPFSDAMVIPYSIAGLIIEDEQNPIDEEEL